MSVVNLTPIKGKGTMLDRSEELCEAIKRACYEVGDGMPVSMVIGCLEIAKTEIIQEQQE